MRTRSIFFYVMWYGKRDPMGYMIPTATVAEVIRELAKYEAAFPCFTVYVGVDRVEDEFA